ncbi:DUF1205 domain-containing protein [Asanoa sp. WMMD1127]|uniref:nucleotide disphospho-sugar-binding domain-containing protein n=1 Tax=Asanoa sp. WMMD1127 TaxID=3016107 RepID=UPI002416CEB7|nr:nucleotide disphospho-sugar-binding domain-containing protein [Asanoa sp. WMMD1127]MDG4820768.1 DUF1205 domain-containing protein [Asanoa sp. WMMD1127]
MRVLMTTWAWRSHLYAMTPLAWALRAAGHEVRVAAPPALAGPAAGAGVALVPVGADVDPLPAFRTFAGRNRPGDQKPAGGGPAARGVPRALTVFAEIAEAMAGDLIEFTRAWRPDLVVYDPTAWAGAFAAAATGTPAVRHAYGLDLLSRLSGPVADLLAPLAARHGLDPVDPAAAPTVDPCPGRFQLDTLADRLPMRYVPFNGPGTQESPLPAPRRPRVCVTWGTTMARLDPAYLLIGPVISVLAGTGVEVVVAVTAAQRPLLGVLPPGVRVVTDVPLHLVVPGSAALVAHGGAGTMLTGLSHGVPQVLIPQLPDHAVHARRLTGVGAGLVIDRDGDLTDVRIREAVGRVLDEDGYRLEAAALAADMAAQPTPNAVAAALAELARVPQPAGTR